VFKSQFPLKRPAIKDRCFRALGPNSSRKGKPDLWDISSDPDGTIPHLYAYNVPPNATFEDHGNGAGTFVFNPTTSQAAVYRVVFVASDGALADSEGVEITVAETNQRPTWLVRPLKLSRGRKPDPRDYRH